MRFTLNILLVLLTFLRTPPKERTFPMASPFIVIIFKGWRQEANWVRLQKETSCLSNLEQCLKIFGFKFQQFYKMIATTIPVPSIGFFNFFV